jgi:RNA polymerase sigma-70 factor (family 1)
MRTYSDFNDNELLSFLRSGDHTAFTEIYERYWKTLYALAYNRLRNIQAAEDIVHEVFTSLWNNKEQASIKNLPAYLATAVKYLIIGNLRKVATHSDYLDSVEYYSDVVLIDPIENLHNKRLLALLQQEVERLPEKCKLVFKYSREQHKSVKEIADELQISPSTVENQLNKALGRLKIVLKNFNILFF